MNHHDHFPSVRLAISGCLSLPLLLWIGFWNDASWRLFVSPYHGVDENPLFFAVTAGLALLILMVLIPVLWRGPAGDRWLAALLALFPISLFAIAVAGDFFLRSAIRL